MRKHTIAASIGALALGVTGVCAGVAPAALAAPSEGTTPKTLVIGVDGAAFDIMAETELPNVRALQAGGLTAASNLPGNPMAPTVSGAGWSTIATGVWPDKHNVVDNNFTAPKYDQYPDYLTRIEAAQPERSTSAIGTWGPISTTVFGAAVDTRVKGAGDKDTTAQVVAKLAEPATDDVFVHLDEVDGAGHSSGSSSQAYRDALVVADRQIGEMIAAVQSRPSYASEDWLIMLTSDHGHTPKGGHGGSTKLERKTHVIAQGAEFAPGSVRHDVKISDIAPTVLAHNGIARDEGWDLDGAAVNDLVADDFDTLRPQLRVAAQETGPGQLLGWTDVAPEGWTVDNSKMPSGGAPEFRGWTFMTDDFFSNVELGQHRENNVRSRDVFAVADSDEWADVSPRGGNMFDSTLVTPAYELNGAATADVSFVSDYAVDGPQGASVWVVFDEESGAPRQKLIDYPADGTRANPVNTVERHTIELPRDAAGALPKTLSLQFSYSGNNSAFWAIDQVRFGQPDAPIVPAEIALSVEQVTAGERVSVTGTGFVAGEELSLELRSAPQLLGTATAGADGALATEVEIPATTPAGAHSLVVVRADGTELALPLAVIAADTGTDPEPEPKPEPKPDPKPGTDAGAGTTQPGESGGSPLPSGELAVTGGSVPALLVGGAVAAALLGGGVLLAVRSRRGGSDAGPLA
ncbi:alkaline phosphatase family protein [Leucobacter chromiireducens]|uniref:alkaline phosphatase family protein n=1 Tax=Leucobacter chromiireducens TaxID=283877 RepID=UPI003F7F0609